ncbi:MAG: hypothetical protein ABI475_07660 [Methylophilaceae bacterium]
MQVHENLHALETNMTQLENELATLHSQSIALDQMLLRLMKAAKPAPSATMQ